METTILEKQDEARDESVEAVFLSILRQKDLDIRDKKAAIVDFIAAGIHTVRESRSIMTYTVVTNTLLWDSLYLLVRFSSLGLSTKNDLGSLKCPNRCLLHIS